MRAIVKTLKCTTGISHLLLIPYYLLQGIVDLYEIPFLIIITLHIITIVLAKKASMKAFANYIGILAILVAFFPYIQIAIHIIASIFLLLDAASTNTKEVYDS
ncbi:hypothetical protein FT637_19895 [Bacillus cereus]|uniref:hypothetical protein n=1 Tax=Bacillus cereus TaxID=1396 RepID=UPI00187ABC74|nr:hypothetical protein [Bacillus cereus]MBE7105213.1 hypothetical protein [Bacillus cereus]